MDKSDDDGQVHTGSPPLSHTSPLEGGPYVSSRMARLIEEARKKEEENLARIMKEEEEKGATLGRTEEQEKMNQEVLDEIALRKSRAFNPINHPEARVDEAAMRHKEVGADVWKLAADGCLEELKVELKKFPHRFFEGDVPFGHTPLHYACYWGRREVAEWLIKAGGKVDLQNSLGNTPCHEACIHGHHEIALLLVATYNAVVTIRNYQGRTAFECYGDSVWPRLTEMEKCEFVKPLMDAALKRAKWEALLNPVPSFPF